MLQCENIQINTASTVNADKKINIVSVQEISKIAQAVQYKISHFYVYVSFAPSEELLMWQKSELDLWLKGHIYLSEGLLRSFICCFVLYCNAFIFSLKYFHSSNEPFEQKQNFRNIGEFQAKGSWQ